MVKVDILYKYFPDFTETQKKQFDALYDLYVEWNEKINVISRKDIEQLYVHHVLHALGIAKFIDFKYINNVLDIGTGGGFPGIPLAIMFPKISFHLVDSIGKKITVVKAIAESIELTNIKAEQKRAEDIKAHYDLITCRAVTQLSDFYGWIQNNIHPNTIIACLKGGDLTQEIRTFKDNIYNSRMKVSVKQHLMSSVFEEDFFETKLLVVVKQ
ncbi:MAG: 16S rRNA (guanine(527)-N(7))-methyltransferase RsmG [Bacteroidetes bacterium]|nr:16S rRNA (guanine(527)-N(7))-methyltransferase RsmG [Bacteroidota bacterium]